MTDNVTTPTTPVTPTGSVLDQLVGPDKKFKSTEDLAKGKMESDAFVGTITRENRELRELMTRLDAENQQLRTRASIVDRLAGTSPDPQGNPQPQPQTPSVTPAKGLTAEDVAAAIVQHEQEKIASQNRAILDSTLAKTFGTEAAAFVKQRAAELGMPHEELVQIGMRSPDAFFRMLDIQKSSSSGNPMYVGNQAGPQGNQQPNVRNYAWYQAKRREMGNVAYLGDKNLQLSMHKDAMAMGDDFYK